MSTPGDDADTGTSTSTTDSTGDDGRAHTEQPAEGDTTPAGHETPREHTEDPAEG